MYLFYLRWLPGDKKIGFSLLKILLVIGNVGLNVDVKKKKSQEIKKGFCCQTKSE